MTRALFNVGTTFRTTGQTTFGNSVVAVFGTAALLTCSGAFCPLVVRAADAPSSPSGALPPSSAPAASSPLPASPPAASTAGQASASVRVTINGAEVSDLEHPPVIRDGVMLIPLNGILDRMATTVSWEPVLKRVEIERGATHVQLAIGSAEAIVNGKTQEMDRAPELDGDSVLVPLRFLADTLGIGESWDATSRTVTLISAPSTSKPTPAGRPDGSPAAPVTSVPSPASGGAGVQNGSGTPLSGIGGASPVGQGSGSDTLPPLLPPSVTNPSPSAAGVAVGESGSSPAASAGALTGASQAGLNANSDASYVPPEGGVPALPAVSDRDVVSGKLANIENRDGSQRLKLDTAPYQALALSPRAIVLANDPGRPGRREISLRDLVPGDPLTLQFDPERRVSVIELSAHVIRDRIEATSGRSLLLSSGTAVSTTGNPVIVLPDGQIGHLADLQKSQAVTLRQDPTTGLVYRVDARVASGEEMPVQTARASRLMAQSEGPFRAGDVLEATLYGAPGGQASFSIPGVKTPASMQEVQPGVYRGKISVPAGLSLTHAVLVGQLSCDGLAPTTLSSPTPIVIDSTPPVATELSPAPRSNESNHHRAIFAVLDDRGGSGVDPESVHLTLNGEDLTPRCQVTDRFVTCPDLDLVDGTNHATLSFRDRAGNFTVTPWVFQVVSVESAIHSVSYSSSSGRGGVRLKVTMEGVSGGDATFDVGKEWLAQPMKEVKPGRYEGTLVLEKGDTIVAGAVVGRLRMGDHLFSRLASTPLNHVDGRPGEPSIETPVAGSEVDAPLVVSGKSEPGEQVRVRIEYDNRVLSAFGLRGFSSERLVTTDDRGIWRTGPMPMDTMGRARHVVYRITAEALNAEGAASHATHITVYRDAP